ncbi:hypothetical protein QW131_05575 [Roseibium salinum]|nr:hypothetical protein [Roseibium salinum]
MPEIQEELLGNGEGMVFCVAVDRNGYLPVHNMIYSKPQKPDDPAWNTANCREQEDLRRQGRPECGKKHASVPDPVLCPRHGRP